MKKTIAIFLFVFALALASWHFAVERRQSIVIHINGTPSTVGLLPFAAKDPAIIPDEHGRYRLPRGMSTRLGFELKCSPNTNWVVNFPESGTKRIDISGTDITTTNTQRYFGIFKTEETSSQISRP